MKFLGIIPARYGSSRFPGKPLVDINGKTMIHRVFERAKQAIEEVYVATDDKRIFDAVTAFGGNVVMTSEHHKSGTDRCAEALEIISKDTGKSFDVIINIQGDEPFLNIEQIESLKDCFLDNSVQIATLIKKIEKYEDLHNPNKVKVVFEKSMRAIYFSRSVIPFYRDAKEEEALKKHSYYKHLGVYAYRTGTLKEITCLMPSSLEIAESLEQNRWIENGYKIKVTTTHFETPAIDTKEDLDYVLCNFFKFSESI